MGEISEKRSTVRYGILKEVVKDYPGLIGSVESLLAELNHPAPAWGVIIKDLRTYALKNFYLHDHHEKGPDVVRTIADIFIEAFSNPEECVQQAAVESLIRLSRKNPDGFRSEPWQIYGYS